MKYKVGDKVMYGDLGGKVIKTHESDYYDLLIKWDNGDIGWRQSATISPNYRALYEQEKAMHEALQKYLSVIEKVDSSDPMEKLLWNNYQQLKQKYGQDTGAAR